MNRVTTGAIISMACFSSVWTAARSDELSAPQPSIYADGHYGFKVIPNPTNETKPAFGVLFTLNRDGSNREVWRGQLVNMPFKVFVGSTRRGTGPFVATVDGYFSRGREHSIVIYVGLAGNMSLGNGSLCWDCPLEFLLPKKEIARARHSELGTWWADNARFAFEENDFVIRMNSGLVVRLDLLRGTMSRGDGTPLREMPTGTLRRPKTPGTPSTHNNR